MASDERPIADVIDLYHVRRRDLLGGLIHEYQLTAQPRALTPRSCFTRAREYQIALEYAKRSAQSAGK